MNSILLYRQCTGINNKLDSARLPYSPENGNTDLESGMDMIIDASGGLVSRRGSTNILAGLMHSSYPADQKSFYFAKDSNTTTAIGKAITGSGGSLDIHWIRSGLNRLSKIDWCTIGDKVFYMNGFQSGVLDGDVSKSWPVSIWPRETVADFKSITPGNHLDMISGRFIISYGKEIVFTEYGLHGIFNGNAGRRMFPSRVLMIYSIGTGVFISDEKNVYFCNGRDPNKWEPVKVLNYPADEFGRENGSIDPSRYGFDSTDQSALFTTENGPVIGFPDGKCVNLIDKKVKMPMKCACGSIMTVDESIILQSGV